MPQAIHHLKQIEICGRHNLRFREDPERCQPRSHRAHSRDKVVISTLAAAMHEKGMRGLQNANARLSSAARGRSFHLDSSPCVDVFWKIQRDLHPDVPLLHHRRAVVLAQGVVKTSSTNRHSQLHPKCCHPHPHEVLQVVPFDAGLSRELEPFARQC